MIRAYGHVAILCSALSSHIIYSIHWNFSHMALITSNRVQDQGRACLLNKTSSHVASVKRSSAWMELMAAILGSYAWKNRDSGVPELSFKPRLPLSSCLPQGKSFTSPSLSLLIYKKGIQFSSVQTLSRVRLFATPWTTAHQASLSITNSRRLLILMSIESVMPSNHLILCRPIILLPPIFPSIRVFSNESVFQIRWPKYWSFSFNISLPMNIQD